MEKTPLFCVYDNKVEGYLPPFTAMNRAVAVRMFESAVMKTGTDFNDHAEDYSLWETGVFDPSTGLSGPRESGQKQQVVEAHHIIAKYRNQGDESGAV